MYDLERVMYIYDSKFIVWTYCKALITINDDWYLFLGGGGLQKPHAYGMSTMRYDNVCLGSLIYNCCLFTCFFELNYLGHYE